MMNLDLILFSKNNGIFLKEVGNDKSGIKWWSQMI